MLAFFWFLTIVHATVFVLQPSSGSVCHGGAPCTVEWIEDGEQPLLNAIGVSTVGLFTGNQQIVQRIEPVDVANLLSFNFTPNPQAGPDSDTYYIAFSSVDLEVNGTQYTAFSPFFRLDGMSGSFGSPLPSATSTIPIPSSLTHFLSNTLTVTFGTPSPSTSSLSTTTPIPESSTSFTFPTATTSSSVVASVPASASPSPSSNSVKLHVSVPALITSFVLLLVV